jgi:hypothetical protein
MLLVQKSVFNVILTLQVETTLYSTFLTKRLAERLLREAGDMEGETWTMAGPVEALCDQRRGEFDGVWSRSR